MRHRLFGFALLTTIPFTHAHAAATYSQGFDDVAGGTPALQGQGWIFRDQSSADGQFWWNSYWTVSFNAPVTPSQDGPGLLQFVPTGSAQAVAQVSAWAILPAIQGLTAGDVLSFYARGSSYEPSTWSGDGAIEVRYSPSGGTSTGSTPTSVGDFVTLLHSTKPADGAPYVQHKVVVPGAGRIAIRLRATDVPMFGFTPQMLIDTLEFNPPPPPVPIPGPGETVSWTLSLSPILIDDDTTIPPTGTVLIDPGVQVLIASGKRLDVLGLLQANGTASAPVVLSQLGANAQVVPWPDGELNLNHAHVDVEIHPRHGPAILAADCTFTGAGSIVNAFDALLDPERTLLRLDRCQFVGAKVQMDQVVAALRDVDFQQQSQSAVILFGYVLLDGVSVDGTSLWLGKVRGAQPVLVDDVSVTNSDLHGGLYLMDGTDFLLGPNNVLANNRWPVEFGPFCAGLLPGSVVPTSGNVNDHVMDTDHFDPQRSVTWGALDVPYVVRIQRFLGDQRVLPGARVLFMPDTGWQADAFGTLDAIGTEAQPIVFEPFLTGQPWQSIELFHPERSQRMEHCILRGASRAVVSENARFVSCRFEDCADGLFATASGGTTEVEKSRFHDNLVGVNASLANAGLEMSGAANPSAFSGNGVALRGGTGSAIQNWWGAPSGPFHPVSNPQGQGDPIETSPAIPFQPFLAAPPDHDDAPPHVELLDGLRMVVEPGRTLLLSWTASDDGVITSQRLLFSPNWNLPGTFQPVATLDPDRRTAAFEVPDTGLQVNNLSAFLRIEAVDDAGQVGYDEIELRITQEVEGHLQITADVTGPFVPGDEVEVTFVTSGVNPVVAPSAVGVLLLDGDDDSISLGGATYSLGSVGSAVMPEVSTDRARIGVALTAGLNRESWFFSEPFSIRVDPRVGDTPPDVTLTAPEPGDAFLAGDTLPVRWAAGDDEALRSFDVLVSTDGGRRFTYAARELPAAARAFDVHLPDGVGLTDLRVRVVARDKRYQNSADDVDCVVVAGDACQADLGYGSPDGPKLSLCGAPLASGESATLMLAGAPASQPGLLVGSTVFSPTPFLGGTLVTVPIVLSLPVVTGAGGQLTLGPVPGGSGPFTFYLQAVVRRPRCSVRRDDVQRPAGRRASVGVHWNDTDRPFDQEYPWGPPASARTA